MKAESQKTKEKLQLVAGFVPPAVHAAIQKIAASDDRTVSQVVRIALEKSPVIIDAINKAQSQSATS